MILNESECTRLHKLMNLKQKACVKYLIINISNHDDNEQLCLAKINAEIEGKLVDF